MYLRTIELLGFKSFAKRTRLDFEPGMTAIVGPNGCGKSNVLDAIRWVLGEQSPKALRGSKMEDIIFGGTDDRKPLGMAEVSITLTDCERVLGTEYNEVTVTRRVYRSGEGEYLMNAIPCRLKDIHRLFMDTGIGTTSYSLMEQGRIDQILSSRPEDRREVFEEASGITKFKSDKKEAIRKLEQTETNVLRLTDVIQEVKRQIVSLKRQAGKARRYQDRHVELRKLDIFLTKNRIRSADEEVSQLKSKLTALGDQLEATQAEMAEIERNNVQLHRSLSETENVIESLVEARATATSELERAKDSIRLNTARIAEAESFSERETREMANASSHLEEYRKSLTEMQSSVAAAAEDTGRAEQDRDAKAAILASHEEEADKLRLVLEKCQTELVETETSHSQLQNDLVRMDAGKRADSIRKERLSAEKQTLEKEVKSYADRLARLQTEIQALDEEAARRKRMVDDVARALAERESEVTAVRIQCSEIEAQLSAAKARQETLETDMDSNGLEPQTKSLIEEDAGRSIIGALADLIDAEHAYRLPLEAAVRTWLDALVVAGGNQALALIQEVRRRNGGTLRLLAADASDLTPPHIPESINGDRLVDHVKYPETIATLVRRLLGNVVVVDALASLPPDAEPGLVFVTRDGSTILGEYAVEFRPPGNDAANPLARKRLVSEIKDRITDLTRRLDESRAQLDGSGVLTRSASDDLQNARAERETHVRNQALKEGEYRTVEAGASQAKSMLETVTWEVSNLLDESEKEGENKVAMAARLEDLSRRRDELRSTIGERYKEIQTMERQRASLSAEAMEARLRHSEARQRTDLLDGQLEPMVNRLAQLEVMVTSRTEGLSSREMDIADLKRQVEEARSSIPSLEAAVLQVVEQIETARSSRRASEERIVSSDHELSTKRTLSDELHEKKSDLQVQLAEGKIRFENMIERIAREYGMTSEAVEAEPDPVWETGEPQEDWIEMRITELHTQIDAMGPVNLVAIDEYEQLEERNTFLSNQMEDLSNSRQKLVEMINKINRTTSQMFAETFAAINQNFDGVFRKLFNGGSAKLILVDEEDVLESGIEIIARPPGKRLQNVSLLSGGERTLTAVSLLFAIYMVKPSPFCVLDELDAPLDDSNIGRFVKMLKGFIEQSQFLVITHSQQTIASANVIYGVTMEEKGVSRTVSLKFVDGHPQKIESSDTAGPDEQEASVSGSILTTDHLARQGRNETTANHGLHV